MFQVNFGKLPRQALGPGRASMIKVLVVLVFFPWFSREQASGQNKHLEAINRKCWFHLIFSYPLFHRKLKWCHLGRPCADDGAVVVWYVRSCPCRRRRGTNSCEHTPNTPGTLQIPCFMSLGEKSKYSLFSSWVHGETAVLYSDRARSSHVTYLTLENMSRVGKCKSPCMIFHTFSFLRVTGTAPDSACEGLAE